jgi:hypothetical protein
MYVWQRLMFLLEKENVLYALQVTLLMCTSQLKGFMDVHTQVHGGVDAI